MQRVLNPVVALLACAIAAGACSSTPPAAQDSRVLLGDTLHGRLAEGRTHQAFTFEGVESTLLDAYVRADHEHFEAPEVSIHDPEGQPLDVAAHITSRSEDHEVVIRGLVLPKTGTYKVICRPGDPAEAVFYKFSHGIRWAPMPDRKVVLTAARTEPVYVAAPRGGVITFRIKPDRGSAMEPEIQAVKDPWGGPALDPSEQLPGAAPPQMDRTADGATVLTFTAPRSGMYQILTAAKAGKEGVGTLHVGLKIPKPPRREVFHDDGAARGFGLPGPTAARGTLQRPATGASYMDFPAPPPPPSGASRVAPPAPPVDDPIAQR